MSDEHMIVTTTVDAPVETVFAVLADPSSHQHIDGTGWVREPVDERPLADTGQIFRIGMYHPNHPDGEYEMANKVTVLDRPRAIAWEPGQEGPDGDLSFGGWFWRYDLASVDTGKTDVTLTYDWSAVPQEMREHIGFPPFDVTHLEQSLGNLATIAKAR